MVISSSGKKNMRSFVVVNVDKHGGCKTKFKAGRYINRNPVGAARKAFNQFCRQKQIRGICTLVVTVKEITQGSKGKSFSYKLHRRKLAQPMIMFEGTNSEYVIEYKLDAKALKEPIVCKNKGQTRGRMSKRTKRKGKRSANNVRKLRKKLSNKSNASKKLGSRINKNGVRKSTRNTKKTKRFMNYLF
tara:strand:- start:26 stop:589 length:564 start_codon:yes stop_codon:yes gene_type:complete